MNSYDSDSSLDDDDQSGTSTNVLLGYATKDAVDDSISQLGGEPTWLSPDHPPSASLAKCQSCNNHMALLLQLNGELPDRFPGHERRLYIFACRRPACRRKPGSIRTIRGVRVAKPAKPKTKTAKPETASAPPETATSPPPAQNTNIGASLFGSKPTTSSASNPSNPFASSSTTPSARPANPFSTAPAPVSTLAAKPSQATHTADKPSSPSASDNITTLPQTFAQKARISTTPATPPPPPPTAAHEPWPPSSARPHPYPTSFLDAEYEYLTQPARAPPHASLMEVDDTTTAAATAKDDADAYESTHDAAFQHFADVLAQNPEQVLRYDFAGPPLLYSRRDAVGRRFSPAGVGAPALGIPRCARCGAARVFEVQLTPYAIVELEGGEDAVEVGEGMEWGSVIVGVCERDCGGGGGEGDEYLEEWAGVQWEEEVGARR